MILNVKRRNYARKVLLQLGVGIVVATGFVSWQWATLYSFYWGRDHGPIGPTVNGLIFVLLIMGVARLAQLLVLYTKEERQLDLFETNTKRNVESLTIGIDTNAMIYGRMETVKRLSEKGPVDFGALASIAVASQSTLTSFARFLNNVFILVGMLGTIASLALALTGASDLLENIVDTKGMGLIISGMSTALSTTLTAIVCYLFFGYFYLRVTDVQTHVLQKLEHLTVTERYEPLAPFSAISAKASETVPPISNN